ncbi:MAG: DUF433 domain-containing protein [Gemmatimonadales bacterium]
MRALHLVVSRRPSVRRGAPVFAGTSVPVRALIDHLDRGGDLEQFLARHDSVARDQALAACALGLEALLEAIPLDASPPQRSLLPRTDRDGVIQNAEELEAAQVVGRRVRCPGCRDLVFQSWPGGWDSHAATRCRGLAGADERARKAEFKRRFSSLFR